MAELYHHGILGMHWGIRRFQNKDGSLTPSGKKRYEKDDRRKYLDAEEKYEWAKQRAEKYFEPSGNWKEDQKLTQQRYKVYEEYAAKKNPEFYAKTKELIKEQKKLEKKAWDIQSKYFSGDDYQQKYDRLYKESKGDWIKWYEKNIPGFKEAYAKSNQLDQQIWKTLVDTDRGKKFSDSYYELPLKKLKLKDNQTARDVIDYYLGNHASLTVFYGEIM